MTFPGSKHDKTYLRTIVGDDAATALLVIDGTDFIGDSKKHPGDRFNYTIGESLAIARALRDAAEWYERQAESLIEYMEQAPVWTPVDVWMSSDVERTVKYREPWQ